MGSIIFGFTAEEIVAAALKLDRKTRAELAHQLIVSLDEGSEEVPEAEWERLWGEEADRRLQELRDGKVEETPGEEVIAKLRALRA